MYGKVTTSKGVQVLVVGTGGDMYLIKSLTKMLDNSNHKKNDPLFHGYTPNYQGINLSANEKHHPFKAFKGKDNRSNHK